LLIYQPIPTPDELDAALTAMGVSKYVPITCDSADRYVSEKHGVVQMVRDLFDRGWEVSKVSKTKSIMYWLTVMKSHKIHIVKNHLWGKMQTFPTFLEGSVISTPSLPVTFCSSDSKIKTFAPDNLHKYGWSAARYALMSHELDNLSVDFE